jgi:hypothetical protein
MRRGVVGIVLGGLLTGMLGACTTGGGYAVSVGDQTTLTYGWEERFGLTYTVQSETAQTRSVEGRVYCLSSVSADRMRLLVTALDGSGRPVAQQIIWLPTGVSGGAGTYFEAHGLPATAQYRVTVWDYSRLEAGDFR